MQTRTAIFPTRTCINNALRMDKTTDKCSYFFFEISPNRRSSKTSTKTRVAAIFLQKQATRNWRENFLGRARTSGTFGT